MNIEKAVLSTKECHTYCGSETIFEELEAIYGHRILRPLRTLPNHSRTWARHVVAATITLAQSEGILNDRPKVEIALEKLRSRRRAIKAQVTSF